MKSVCFCIARHFDKRNILLNEKTAYILDKGQNLQKISVKSDQPF